MDRDQVAAPRFCQYIDGFIHKIGNVVAWLNVVLIVNIIVQVVLRYAFGEGMVWLEELQWHFYGVCIMFAISYTLVDDAHIRLDIFYQRFSARTKAQVEFWGLLILVLPLVAILFWHGLSFVESAWRVSERSESPLGLPYRWLIKSVLPASMFLWWIAAFSRMVRSALVAFGKKTGKQG